MKYFMLVICVFYTFQPTFAQNTIGKINYDFHLNLQNFEEAYVYNSVLLFNANESIYTYNSAVLEGKAGFKKNVKYKSGPITGGLFFRQFDQTGQIYYFNKTNMKMISRELLHDKYPVLVQESTPVFNWKIEKEHKMIGEYICYKAISNDFRGRAYEAWFTYEIPYSFGPWKFQGLPGLIIEVFDDLNQIHIKAKDINYPVRDQTQSIIPVFGDEQYTAKEFLKENFYLYQRFIENQKALQETGSLPSNFEPLPYRAIEYIPEQIEFLNELKAIYIID